MSWGSRRIIVFVLVALMIVALAAVSVSALTQSNPFIKPVQAQYKHPNSGQGNGSETGDPGQSGGHNKGGDEGGPQPGQGKGTPGGGKGPTPK